MHGCLQRDESLVHEIEGVIKRKLGEYSYDEKAVFEDNYSGNFYFFSFCLIFILEGIVLFCQIQMRFSKVSNFHTAYVWSVNYSVNTWQMKIIKFKLNIG